jgi:hypothetical protein
MTARDFTRRCAVVLVATTAFTAAGSAQTPALAPPVLAAGVTPWVLSADMGYGYDGSGKTFAYQMGTSNAKLLLKGAKKVPKNTLFFVGANGQLYMRSGPFLEDDGRFKFGPG